MGLRFAYAGATLSAVSENFAFSPLTRPGAFVLLVAWAFVVLFPIYWLVVTSFKTPYDYAGLQGLVAQTREAVSNERMPTYV